MLASIQTFFKTTYKLFFVGFFIVAAVAAAAISYYQTQNQVKQPQNAKASEIIGATVAILPSSQVLPPDQTFQIQATSTSQVAFAKVAITFDTTKIKLKEEVSMTGSAFIIKEIPQPTPSTTAVTNLVEKTTLTQANVTGTINIAIGLHPDQKTTPPTGTFQLASLVFTPVTTTNTTTMVQIPTASVQLVDINGVVISSQTQNATLSLNQPSSTPIPTTTPTPRPTSTPVPTATLTPRPTSTPVPTYTPTPIPTNTPVPTATPTPKPTSTPIPTVPPVSGTSTIVIYAGGTQNGGTYPNMQLLINGKAVTSWSNINADGRKRLTQQYTYVSSTKVTAWNQIQVAFTNDKTGSSGDRNLFVDKITLDGVVRETELSSTYSTGTWSQSTRCAPGNKQSEWLHCNGSFTY
jgi:hypothetical protein